MKGVTKQLLEEYFLHQEEIVTANALNQEIPHEYSRKGREVHVPRAKGARDRW